MTSTSDPQRGDVVRVDFADPDPTPMRRKGARMPAPNERVAIRLHGHPATYVVRVMTNAAAGPTISELTVIADEGQAVDYAAVRAIPVRRLAYSAAGWIDRAGGRIAFPGDYSETRTKPEVAATAPNDRLHELAWRIESAIMGGEPVRPTVAREMHVSTSTLDRMIAKARAEGLLDGVELPRRPSPQQRDALHARYLIEQWLDENGPDAEPPPEIRAEIERLQRNSRPDNPTIVKEDDQ
ncbi:Uncharacterised protein [Mycobacteroides abscessus subsp. abscessus]|uniref:hypothetical protein n=1 Tax=Mycobacteroides abscessus TaxID=36809 RepID=UPI00092B5888|nr:hypothetical protein [Mycobacteroides abscessus]SIL58010.1 Uncharacterised protein [Mycobacteroides abscessus subsp. abscessus]SLC82120.1 Uncharacterised protein [Mycobacteroides abscessus subsp. abscessus]